MILTLSIVLIVASLLLIVLVLLHRGKGGGLSSMLGGSFYSSLSGSSVVERNLDRLTVIAGGRIVATGTPQELISRLPSASLEDVILQLTARS